MLLFCSCEAALLLDWARRHEMLSAFVLSSPENTTVKVSAPVRTLAPSICPALVLARVTRVPAAPRHVTRDLTRGSYTGTDLQQVRSRVPEAALMSRTSVST